MTELSGKRFELSIGILDKDYVDKLIVSLVRQGYEVYIVNENGKQYLNFGISGDELFEIKDR